MTKTTKTLLFLIAIIGAPACAVDAPAPGAGEAPATSATEDEQALAQHGVAFLKQRILQIARANTTRTDNIAEVKAQLRPYVRALVLLTPPISEAEKLARSEGAWHSLWTDLRFDRPLDRTRIYQVVTTVGHYWNLSLSEIGGVTRLNALRGAYAPIPEGLAIRFTTSGLVDDTVIGKDGAGLVQLAADIESGVESLSVPGPFPPVTGKLLTYYIDADLRILGGENAPLFDDDGNVYIPGQYDELFVLERHRGVVQ